jgi:Asp-tRNA(Asn)/Glu-tRNA(Gln) amidotransferase B subunit
MSTLLSDEIVKIDDMWIHGLKIYNDGSQIPYMKMTDDAHRAAFWFLESPSDIFNHYGWKIDNQKADALLVLFDHDIVELTYYLYSAANEISIDMVVNVLIGPIAEWKKIHSAEQKKLPINSLELKEFVLMTTNDSFIKSKYKDAMLRILDGESLEDIKSDESYWSAGEDELKELVLAVVREHTDKIKSDNHEKMTNWLTGQVMKASKGKADPTKVKSIIMEML